MEPNMVAELQALKEKIDLVYKSVEKTRKYFLYTMIVTIALFILPLLGLMFVIPSFINMYTTNLEVLTQ